MLNSHTVVFLYPGLSGVCGLVDVTGPVCAGPHYLRVQWIHGKAEDWDCIARGAGLARNARVAGLPGEPVVRADKCAGVGVGDVPGVGVVEVVADVVAESAGRSTRADPGQIHRLGKRSQPEPSWRDRNHRSQHSGGTGSTTRPGGYVTICRRCTANGSTAIVRGTRHDSPHPFSRFRVMQELCPATTGYLARYRPSIVIRRVIVKTSGAFSRSQTAAGRPTGG